MEEAAKPPRLLDRLREAVRVRHYSIRTEEAYVNWARRFILFHDKRHPSSMGVEQVNAFLTHLAVNENVSASTQNQALSAIFFLYRHVLDDPLPWITDVVRAAKPHRLPLVLSRDEVRRILGELEDTPRTSTLRRESSSFVKGRTMSTGGRCFHAR
ncbi:MAG TPA: phage integrase N-terminal SAM-like domain-containing protein [Thermoanaerobaculia bacterium]|jgi:site-specific recombinase XerD|nr:phage integrase N-terminal SAM-like domain-containing protein [Thermoanaerobaculia bacterium]